jgi:hypothetical protein
MAIFRVFMLLRRWTLRDHGVYWKLTARDYVIIGNMCTRPLDCHTYQLRSEHPPPILIDLIRDGRARNCPVCVMEICMVFVYENPGAGPKMKQIRTVSPGQVNAMLTPQRQTQKETSHQCQVSLLQVRPNTTNPSSKLNIPLHSGNPFCMYGA